MSDYHQPVLLQESVDALITDSSGIYVDVTYGGGGHTREVLRRLTQAGRVIALDQDEDALAQAEDDARLELIHANFRYLKNFLQYHGVEQVQGILADLGVSSFQLDEKAKGFSFASDSALDMRMNRSSSRSASDILNLEKEEDLVLLFSQYGEVRNSKSLSRAIVGARRQRPFRSIGEFVQCIEPLIMGNRARYLAQVFQAIRIKVNDEMGALKDLLTTSGRVLSPGGRLVVITYHSIEDRIVKHYMRRGTFDSTTEVPPDSFGRRIPWRLRMITKKPILATPAEVSRNRRARSAKLRVAERV